MRNWSRLKICALPALAGFSSKVFSGAAFDAAVLPADAASAAGFDMGMGSEGATAPECEGTAARTVSLF